MQEQIIMKLEVMGAETLGKLNRLFREKVQLKEQADENEVNIHFHRGYLHALDDVQKVVREIGKGEKIAEMYEAKV